MRDLTDEELGKYNLVLFGDAGAAQGQAEGVPSPALRYDSKATATDIVTAVNYTHEWAYIRGSSTDIGTDF